MSVWTLVVAALPIPVGLFKLIPSFEAQRSYLSVYTSLFCFLSLGFIFFQRHRLGYYMFRETGKWVGISLGSLPTLGQAMFNITRGFVNWLPLACILLSVFAVFRYHNLFNDAILIAQARATAEEEKGTLAGAFLIDMTAAADRHAKVEIANLVLFENNNTLNARSGHPEARKFIIDELINSIVVEGGKASDVDRGHIEQGLAAGAFMNEAMLKAGRYGDSKSPDLSEVKREAKRFLALPETHMDRDTNLQNAQRNLNILNAQQFVGEAVNVPSADEVLKTKLVPLGSDLMLWYLTIFVAAETAFILMALKEYLQDLAHISDLSLMEMDVKASPQNLPN